MKIAVQDIQLDVHVEGDGTPVLLLHGFPDSHNLWRNQVTALTAAGYQTIAPDLRGFGESDRPDAVDAYNILVLLGDVGGVLDNLGIARAHVVGHDWGAALAWSFAAFVPDRVDHLVAMSVGHPGAFRNAGLRQRQLSWYMLFFQWAGIAEEWLSADDWANFREWAQHPDTKAVEADLARPGALTAALNWYRANLPPETWIQPPMAFPPIASPTMGIWSSGDMALTEEQMTGSSEFVSGPWRYERIEDVGHWMQLEAPDAVNALLLDFLPAPS